MTNCSLMKVKSIAECCPWICGILESGCFTQVLPFVLLSGGLQKCLSDCIRDQILDFQPLAKNSEWLFFSLTKDADQVAFSLKMFCNIANLKI